MPDKSGVWLDNSSDMPRKPKMIGKTILNFAVENNFLIKKDMNTGIGNLNNALFTQQESAWLQEQGWSNDSQLSQILRCLAPWLEKTNGEESVGSWETTMATKMMVKLLELWLTPKNRKRVEKMLEYYHPLDRSAMAYALLVFVMTGREMTFKSAVANQHYRKFCQMIVDDMPELMFADHMEYMIRKYGKVKK